MVTFVLVWDNIDATDFFYLMNRGSFFFDKEPAKYDVSYTSLFVLADTYKQHINDPTPP